MPTNSPGSDAPPVPAATPFQRIAAIPRSLARHPFRSIIGLLVVVVAVSLGAKLAAPGNETLGEKSVEWMRDNHMGGLVDVVERQWYKWHPPKTGGKPPAIVVPSAAGAGSSSASGSGSSGGVGSSRVSGAPTPLTSPAAAPVAGEGQWTAVGPLVGGRAGVYVTEVRPDAVHTSYLEGVAIIDPQVVRLEAHPGLEVPGGSYATPPDVPAVEQSNLIAAFNGGFRMGDARGGFFLDGQGASTLVNGAASLAIDRNGVPQLGAWGTDLSNASSFVSVRQNLDLIVDGGHAVAGLDANTGNRWGATLGNKLYVWRSGVGITADGRLVYVGGPSLSASTLADLLVRAGSVRAMELDINTDWVSFNLYRRNASGSVVGSKLLSEMHKPASRYLTPDSRDFVAVLAR